MQTQLKHKSIIYTHNANPWFVGKSYSELSKMVVPPEKTKLISVISSDKAFTDGHKKRLEFVQKLKNHFADKLDVYGRGIRDFDDKWEVLAPYKYTIAIENDNVDYWVTEKYFDCVYAYSYPFYYGCPNLENIVSSNSFQRIDINNPEEAISIIEKGISLNYFENRLIDMKDSRRNSLQRHNLFPFLVDIFENKNDKSFLSSNFVTIKPFQNGKSKIHARNIRKQLKKLLFWLRK